MALCGTNTALTSAQIAALLKPDSNVVCIQGSCASGSSTMATDIPDNNHEIIVKTAGMCGTLLAGGSCSGDVYDYKLGPTPSRDPATKVGTFTLTNVFLSSSPDTIRYTYGGQSYTYCVSGTGPYVFRNTGDSSNHSVSVGLVP